MIQTDFDWQSSKGLSEKVVFELRLEKEGLGFQRTCGTYKRPRNWPRERPGLVSQGKARSDGGFREARPCGNTRQRAAPRVTHRSFLLGQKKQSPV